MFQWPPKPKCGPTQPVANARPDYGSRKKESFDIAPSPSRLSQDPFQECGEGGAAGDAAASDCKELQGLQRAIEKEAWAAAAAEYKEWHYVGYDMHGALEEQTFREELQTGKGIMNIVDTACAIAAYIAPPPLGLPKTEINERWSLPIRSDLSCLRCNRPTTQRAQLGGRFLPACCAA